MLLDLEAQGAHAEHGAKTMTGYLARLLNLDPAEASARIWAARVCGRRQALSGQRLEPLLPLVAAGQAAGRLSERDRRIIADCVQGLPEAAIEAGPQVEADLVGFAATMPPGSLARAAARISYLYDQDGAFDEVERRRKNRTVTLTQRPDGSSSGTFEATAELTELLQVAFDALAAPKPEASGVKDPRTAGQRRHDALIDAVKAGVSAGSLGSTGGVLATVVLTMTTDAYATGDGFARTGHGTQVPAREALSWAGGDHRLMITALNSLKAITAYAATHTAVPHASLDGWGAAQGPSLTARSSAPSVQAQPPHHRMADQQTHLRRRRHPALRLPPPRIRASRLVCPHDRRPTHLDPTPLDRPHPNTHPHLTIEPNPADYERDYEQFGNCPTP